MKRISLSAATLLAVVLTLALYVSASAQDVTPKVSFTLPKEAKMGTKVKGEVIVTFAEGLHGYQNPPSEDYMIPLVVKAGDKTVKLVRVEYPKGTDTLMGGSDKPVKAYSGTIKIPVTVELPKKAGDTKIKVTVSYQQCDDSSCFPPGEVTAVAKIKVKAK